MEFARDVLQSGEQGDRGLRQAGPDTHDDHRGQGGGQGAEPVAAVAEAEVAQGLVEDARVRVVDEPPHDADDDFGHRPRHDGEGAGQSAQPQALGEEQGQAECEQELGYGHAGGPDQADTERLPEERVVHEVAEVEGADPAGGLGAAGLGVGEGEQDAVEQRAHAEQEDRDQRGQDEVPGAPPGGAATARPSRIGH